MSGERGNQNERTVGLQFVNQMTTSISSNCRKIYKDSKNTFCFNLWIQQNIINDNIDR